MQDFQTLLAHAKKIRLNAYAPYSNFLVGTCLESSSGILYSGCNVENASYGLTMCAEANAIAAMVAGGEYKIQQLLIIATGPGIVPPCGACRQRLAEFGTATTLVHLADLNGSKQTYTMADLLPHAFLPKDLARTK